MTTDNRTNEPKQTEAKLENDFVYTEAQIEAAAEVLDPDAMTLTPEEFFAGYGGFPEWSSSSQPSRRVAAVDAARAALIAAQGAAPQAESACDCGLNGEADCYKPDGSPVLPSSTVDEDALAEVISETATMYNIWADMDDLMRESANIARAVADWLKGQDR